jgi:dihydroorotase
MTGRLLIRGGRILDPASRRDESADLLIEGGRVRSIGRDLSAEGAEVLDAKRLVVCPGFVDVHVHLREPGDEYKETIETGTAAALAGGFTAVCCAPNTRPPHDDPSVTEFILAQAEEAGNARVYPIGAVTRGLGGKELAEMGEMRRAGAVAFTDDGKPVWNPAILRRAMEYARGLEAPILQHAEDPHLRGAGVMNEGFSSTSLGMEGMHPLTEATMVARDILLVELTGARYHVMHVSAALTLREVRRAKEMGLPVTCEATPHHLLLTDAACGGFDANMKMNPPLRSEEDVEALLVGVEDGTVDLIATDHAPHAVEEKEVEFNAAPFGVIGLETAVPLLLDRLVRSGRITLHRLVELLSSSPCRALGLPGGRIEEDAPADLTLLDLEMKGVVEPRRFRSRSRNTPFEGWEHTGGVAATIVDGEVRYRAG